MSLRDLLPASRSLAAKMAQPFQSFFQKEVSSSLLLMASAVLAMIWANSVFSHGYQAFWHTDIRFSFGGRVLTKSLRHWIDEGLMTVFFFTVGLEIKREILVGELASLRKALLPVAAALGGMIVPAALFALLNSGTPEIRGWGIPMATDIAFALGALALLGRRVPLALKIFLSAFAIADDLGAVVVIAVFYTQELVTHYLVLSLFFGFCLALLNGLWVRNAIPYALCGIALWLCVLGSGLHATVAGVIVAAFIPARGKYDTDKFLNEVSNRLSGFSCPPDGCGRSILLNAEHLNTVQAIEAACQDVETPLQRFERALHPWVAYAVIPLFALANGGVTVADIDLADALTAPLTIGVAAGLLIGKPVGICAFAWLAVRSGLAELPVAVSWRHILGAGILGGMGFTMSLFIAGLSFVEPTMLDTAKIGILVGSVLSAGFGLCMLRFFAGENPG